MNFEKPLRSNVYVEHIPDSLKRLNQWVTWRYELRGQKWSKVPYKTDGVTLASSTDTATWGEFSDAVLTYESGTVSGIGFVFKQGGQLCGVDLDDCVDTDGIIKPWAREIIERLNCSYAEITPSGRGLHVICVGHLEKGFRQGKIECYPSGRYFTMTGDILPGCRTVEVGQTALDWLESTIRPKQQYSPHCQCRHYRGAESDDDILRRACDAANGEKFRRLFYGGDIGDYQSASEADLALLSLLMFYCSNIEPLVERLYRQSALFREKADRPDYLLRCFRRLRESRRF